MRRVAHPELLDSRQLSEEDIRKSLVDLERINRWFGGISTTEFLINRVSRRRAKSNLSILDVGSATGTVPKAVQKRMQSKGVELRFTFFDRNQRHFSRNSARRHVVGDALSLPFRDKSFDVVACSLLAHHFEPEQLRQFATESLRVSRIAFVINDLRRSYIHLGLIYAGLPLFRSPITRHDSVASVKRAYTLDEITDIFRTTPAAQVEVHKSYLCRMGVIAWK